MQSFARDRVGLVMSTSRTTACFGFALLAACGTTDPQPTHVTATVSGVVEVGDPVPNATVYLDENANNLLDSGEPSTTTDATGHYTLTWDNPGPEYAHAIGAITNVGAAGLALHLRAPLGDTSGAYTGSAVISPLTTLVTSEMASDATLTEDGAKAKVAAALTASQLPFSGPIDVMADYANNAQLRYVASTVAAIVAGTVAKLDSLQSTIDCNDATYFNPAIVAMDQQLSTIANGTFRFTQLSADEQADVAQNPGNYPDYFIDMSAFADAIENALLADAEDLAAAAFAEIEDQLVSQLEEVCVDLGAELLLEAIG